MAWLPSYTPLRNALVALFPRRDLSQLLVDEAGLRSERIAFSEQAETNWHAILSEADRSSNVPELIQSALGRYPNDAGLRDAVGTYLRTFPEYSGRIVVSQSRVDLAVIAAMPEELNAFLECAGGPSNWEEFALDGFIHHRGTIETDARPIQVVAGSPWKYGGDPASSEVARLLLLKPRMIAMVGICAGREGEDDLTLGDIVVADRAFNPSEGKWKEDIFHPDVQTFQPPAWLVQQLRHFAAKEGWEAGIETPRPARLGRRKPKVFIAPFASDAPILAIPDPFKEAIAVSRKVMAYELEVKSFLSAAAEHGIPALAVKAVSDYGTPDRDPSVRPYALEAAARWLIAFIRATSQHWPA